MTKKLANRALTAIFSLGIVAGATGLAPATAFAAAPTHSAVAHHNKSATVMCTKADVGKAKKSGKTTLVCTKSGKSYKWEAAAVLCTKSDVGKAKTSGKTTWVCAKSGKSYKWDKKGGK